MTGFYPYNPRLGQRIQSDAKGLVADQAFLAHVEWANPAPADVDAVLAATALADGAVTVVAAGLTNPDVPRALSVTGNTATVIGNVVIEGTNIAGEVITETIVANGANTVLGTKAFKTVTKVTLPARGAAGDTISVGVCDKLGLPYKLEHDTVLLAALNNVREAVAPTVTVSATELESNTVDLNSALNGGPVDVYLLV